MKFLKSFKYAFRGIVYCINNERNMRIHTVMMLYVLLFSPFFHLSRLQYAVLFLTVSAVVSAEMMNTAAEELSDMSAADYNPLARIAKDVAAGAVLVCAVFSVFVGICLFWQPDAFLALFYFFAERPWLAVLLVISVVLAVIYVILGPLGLRDKINAVTHKKKNSKSNTFPNDLN